MTLRIVKSNKTLEERLSNTPHKIAANPYFAETRGVQVTVWPEFVDSQRLSSSLFIWAYHVRIDNHSGESLKLKNRYWKIIDEKGDIQEVRGEGVIGEQPTIANNASFQYSSGVHLHYPSGIMSGTYAMQKDNGEIFEVKIPTFSLDAPLSNKLVN